MTYAHTYEYQGYDRYVTPRLLENMSFEDNSIHNFVIFFNILQTVMRTWSRTDITIGLPYNKPVPGYIINEKTST